MSAYTKAELYQMWRDGFRGQAHEARILSDFANCTTVEAKEMLKEFKEREAGAAHNKASPASYSFQFLDFP